MTYTKYIIGFVLSLVLTIIAYSFATSGSVNTWMLAILGVLALVQMVVQLIYFLHLGDETGPRYKLVSFVSMVGILAIIVGGSLWIMQNLNYNMMQMSPDEKSNYMLTEHDKGF
jgi:cytochrome o ubiquinol oxidase operon protein cyoD